MVPTEADHKNRRDLPDPSIIHTFRKRIGGQARLQLSTVEPLELDGRALCSLCDRVVSGSVWRFGFSHPMTGVGIEYHVCLDCARKDIQYR